MDFFNIFYILFALIIIISGILVILSWNPIHSILFLILVFCGAAGILIIVEVEFLAMLFVVVYVGAIAVLFLFVIMMLNVKIMELNVNFMQYLPITGLISLSFLLEIFLVLNDSYLFTQYNNISYINWLDELNSLSNIELVGELIYTYYFILFIIASLILLVAMIGPIVLTLKKDKVVKRQDIYEQVLRNKVKTVVLKDII